jgi:predicted transcriptional regulator
MPKVTDNGDLKSHRFTVRFTDTSMARLHAYTMRLQQKRGRVSYSEALATLVETIPASKLDAESLDAFTAPKKGKRASARR